MVELSLVLSNYNHARFLPQCLDSVFSQSRIPDEVLIVDDCSTDNSLEILDSYAQRYRNISLLRNGSNEGVCSNVNRLVALAKGRYVVGVASDDVWLPGFVEKSLGMLGRFPEAALCCSYPSYLDHKTGKILENRSLWAQEARFFAPVQLAEAIGRYEGCLFGHTCIMKKETFLEAGGFLPELRWHADWFNLLVQGFRHGVCFVPEALAALRILSTSYSAHGISHWHRQRETLRSVLLHLKSDAYADVVELFSSSGVLNTRGDEIVFVTTAYDDLYTEKILRLIKAPSLKYSGLRDLTAMLKDRLGVHEAAALSFQEMVWGILSSRKVLWSFFWRAEHLLRITVRGVLLSLGWRRFK